MRRTPGKTILPRLPLYSEALRSAVVPYISSKDSAPKRVLFHSAIESNSNIQLTFRRFQ